MKEELSDQLLKAVQGQEGGERKETFQKIASKYTGGCTFRSLNEDSKELNAAVHKATAELKRHN